MSSAVSGTPLPTPMSDPSAQRGLPAYAEVLIVVATFVGTYSLGTIGLVPYGGPVAIAASVAVIWALLRFRGETWNSLGLRFPTGVGGFFKGAGYALLVFIGVVASAAMSTPVIELLLGGPLERDLPDVSTFQSYLIMMGIVWTTAAIGEELLFRGFLMTRVAEMFGSGRIAWTLALILPTAVFGLCHAYQGLGGVLLTGFAGLTFGLFYLIGRRNLLPLIVAHGIVNSLGITVLHLQATGALPTA